MNFAPTVWQKFLGIVFARTSLPRSCFCLSLFCSACPCPCHYSSTLVSQSAKTLLTYHNEVLTAFSRDNFMTSLCAATCRSDLPWSSSAISFDIILPCPSLASLLLSQPPLLFHASSLSCFWSALVCFDLSHCHAYYCLGPVQFPWLCISPYSSCPALFSPFQCRADLP